MQDVPVYRAFIAIELPTSIKDALNAITERLKEARLSGVRWVNPEGIHLTLKFLGDVPASRVEAIVEAMSQASTGIAPFILGLGEGGAFPSLKSPRVLWINMAGETGPLHSLQQRLEEGMRKLGFPIERRAFSPHLTIARLRDGASQQNRRRAWENLSRLSIPSGSSMMFSELSLMRSTLLPSGAEYHRLAAVPLSPQSPGEAN